LIGDVVVALGPEKLRAVLPALREIRRLMEAYD
jgi:hypothetical protein